MLYSEEQDSEARIHIYEQISNSNFILRKYRNALIPVYIYLRKKNKNTKVNFGNIIEELEKAIGNNICTEMELYLKSLIKMK